MKRFLKWTGIALAGLVVLCASLAALAIFDAKSEDAEARQFANGESLQIPLSKIERATVDIWEGETLLGRGYFNTEAKTLITNWHVLKHSENYRELSRDREDVAMTLFLNNPATTRLPGRMRLRACCKWMDACLLEFASDKPIDSDPEQTAEPRVGLKLVTLPRDVDRGDAKSPVLVGSASTANRVLVSTDVPARPGYSGSPIFTDSGAFAGIFVTAIWKSGINYGALLSLVGMKPYLMMRQRTIYITAGALHDVLNCKAASSGGCNEVELTTFTNFLEDALAQENMQETFKLEIVQAIYRFGRSFVEAPDEIVPRADDSRHLKEFAAFLAAKHSLKNGAESRDQFIGDLTRLKSHPSCDDPAKSFITNIIALIKSLAWAVSIEHEKLQDP